MIECLLQTTIGAIPRAVEHKSFTESECHVMLVAVGRNQNEL
jgi:hypothetical protein